MKRINVDSGDVAGRGVSKSAVVHDIYVERINALVARGREGEAADLLAEFEMELAETELAA
jgi:hypothetical protein